MYNILYQSSTFSEILSVFTFIAKVNVNVKFSGFWAGIGTFGSDFSILVIRNITDSELN